MRLKTLEETYHVNADIEETSLRVQKALSEIGLKNVAIKKYVPPRYLLVEYSPSWVGKSLEIEFLFEEKQAGTDIAVKWPYTKELPAKNDVPDQFRKYQEEMKKTTERIVTEFKTKIGAVNT
ncbi:MAG: hypothetical protein NWF04_02950 [Candidatus Bathyarchaeota archaeon]|nr:hypothetical protein [Candidatus Bathyarchaeota archaeon]